MTWFRKVQGVLVAAVVMAVFDFFVIPGANWIEGFLGVTF
jgi:hypothetical protein